MLYQIINIEYIVQLIYSYILYCESSFVDAAKRKRKLTTVQLGSYLNWVASMIDDLSRMMFSLVQPIQ